MQSSNNPQHVGTTTICADVTSPTPFVGIEGCGSNGGFDSFGLLLPHQRILARHRRPYTSNASTTELGADGMGAAAAEGGAIGEHPLVGIPFLISRWSVRQDVQAAQAAAGPKAAHG